MSTHTTTDNNLFGILGGITGAVFKALFFIEHPDFQKLAVTTAFSALIGAVVGLVVKESWEYIKRKFKKNKNETFTEHPIHHTKVGR